MEKTTPSATKDASAKNETAKAPSFSAIASALQAQAKAKDNTCERLENLVDNYLHEAATHMYQSLSPCGDKKDAGCGCGGSTGGKKKLVDLIVLLDSSSSMGSTAKTVADAAIDAVAAAAKDCPSDLRVAWFVVDGKKPGANPAGNLGDITSLLTGTPFTKSHQQYLESIGATGPFKQDEPQPAGDPTYRGEEGADAISDLCNFYDWRAGAC